MKLVFVWHWEKRFFPNKNDGFYAEDTLIKTIARLREEGEDSVIWAVCGDVADETEFVSKRQGVAYKLFPSRERLIGAFAGSGADVIFMNHNPAAYDDVLNAAINTSAKTVVYFSAPIVGCENFQHIDCYLVHHDCHAQLLEGMGIPSDRIQVAPKTADMDVFHPDTNVQKRWTCIYPARGGFGYWKRLELAVEACRVAGVTLVLPGAEVPRCAPLSPQPIQSFLAYKAHWFWKRLAWRLPFLSLYPWVTILPWQSPDEMAACYNRASCLLITSNEAEMGPRVIPEAAACNLPIVCCSDSPACVSHTRRLGGFIADPSPKALADCIHEALSKPCRSRAALLEEKLDTWVIYRVLMGLIKQWTP